LKSVLDLHRGESGIIRGISDDQISLKLMEMGCLPGVSVRYEFEAPLGDPICIQVSGYKLSLRKAEATTIILE
jgi:ferrous iron transport protein A